MTGSAARPDPARRPSLGTAVLVVAFIFLAPPLFLLAPLALLLLFSRPRTFREWAWIALAGMGTAKLVKDVAGAPLDYQVITAGGVMMAGAFVLVALVWRRASTVSRSVAAVAAATVGVIAWGLASGIEIAGFDALVVEQFQLAIKLGLTGAPADQAAAIAATAPAAARIYPGWIALQGLAGLGLAWGWYHRVAEVPLDPAPRPFPQFRFNDHLIWGAIFTLGLVLLPLVDPIARVVTCLLTVWIGLYGMRGMAVISTTVGTWPLPGKILLVVLSFLAFPIAIGTMVALGVADTWLDFRNRPVPNAGGGNADGSDSP